MMANLHIEQHGALTVATMPTDVDLASSAEIGERLATGVDKQARTLVLDLSETSYVDSAGLDMLLRLGGLLRRGRRELVLIVPLGSPLRRFFEIVMLPPTVQLQTDLDNAIDDLS
jgi:anti-sigma B factor antagonist